MRLVSHNVWVGQRPRRLRKNLAALARDTGNPLGILTQEAMRLDRAIDGYRRLHAPLPAGHPDDLDMQLLVREDVTIIAPRFVPAGGPWWTGPKHGRKHPPKLFLGATLEHESRRFDVLNVHRCWTGRGRRNMASWRSEHETLTDWLLTRAARDDGTRPVYAIGDWNGNPKDRGYAVTVGELAEDAGAKAAFRGIDGALAINGTVSRFYELEQRFGSDGHNPLVFDLNHAPAPLPPLHACPECGKPHRAPIPVVKVKP